jgi:serine/threonine-protein kinase RIO1
LLSKQHSAQSAAALIRGHWEIERWHQTMKKRVSDLLCICDLVHAS